MNPSTEPTSEPLDERAYSKLKWRCRRGLLENDLFIERYFQRFGNELTQQDARGLNALMDLSDNDLLDLLLRRKEALDELDHPDVHHVLGRMRQAPRPELG